MQVHTAAHMNTYRNVILVTLDSNFWPSKFSVFHHARSSVLHCQQEQTQKEKKTALVFGRGEVSTCKYFIYFASSEDHVWNISFNLPYQ